MLTTKQIEFCKQVANGATAAAAYKIAFKSKSAGNCRVNGCKLLKRAEIKAYIEELQNANKKIVERGHEIAAQKLAEGEIADKIERQKVLTQILRGEIKLSKPMVVDKQVQFIECVPDYADRKAAIAELNKMGGDYSPTKVDVTSNGKTMPSWANGE